ncbi:MAG: CopG family antitoxin [Anaerolineae bacterium]
MKIRVQKRTLPDTDSIEELARFWNKHDLTEFEDELEEVTGPLFERKTHDACVSLDPEELIAVKRIAESHGVEYQALVRDWGREKIHTS